MRFKTNLLSSLRHEDGYSRSKGDSAKAQAGKDAHKDQKKSGEHREVHGTFTVACEKPLAGSRVKFGVSRVFRNIQEIKVRWWAIPDNSAPRSRKTKET